MPTGSHLAEVMLRETLAAYLHSELGRSATDEELEMVLQAVDLCIVAARASSDAPSAARRSPTGSTGPPPGLLDL